MAYIYAFTRHTHAIVHSAAVALPIVALVGGLLYILFPGLAPDLFVPVPIYATVIGIMVYVAAVRVRVEPGGFLPAFVGAALFVLSDSILAIGEFGPPSMRLPKTKLWVMLTYYGAQAFIALAAARQPSGLVEAVLAPASVKQIPTKSKTH